MKIHALHTGMLHIRRAHYRGIGIDRWTRLASWQLMPGFAPPIPMLAWLIEHPEGLLLVDTGETIRAQHDPAYFPDSVRPFYKNSFRFDMQPSQEASAQIRTLGYDPADVRTIILTHSHMDHSDGLAQFPQAEVLISQREWHDVQNGWMMHGAVFPRWPASQKKTVIDYLPESIGAFDESYPVTKDSCIRIVPTPGHTMGHQSVIVQDEGISYFLAGDTSFTEAGLFSNQVDGVTHSAQASHATRHKIRQLAQDIPLVYLPSHDPQSIIRLAQKVIIPQGESML